MLDNTEIVATVQAFDLEPQTDDLDTWVSFTTIVSDGFDEAKRRGIGYIYKQAKRKLKGSFDDYCRAIDVSASTVNKEIRFYEANEEADSLEIEMPKEITASKYATLKGDTPKEKIEHHEALRADLGKAPSAKDISVSIKVGSTVSETETKLKDDVIDVEVEPTKDYKLLYEQEVILHKATKTKLKRERELKDKRNKEKAELKVNTVDLTPLNEAQKELDKFWDSLHTAQRNYMGKLNKEHKKSFTLQAVTEPKHYIVLGLSEGATLNEVKIAYKKLAKQLHPDMKDGNEAKFKKIAEAYKKIKELHNVK